MRRLGGRRWPAALAVAALAAVAAGADDRPARASSPVDGATWYETYIHGPAAGDPPLHADVFLPDGRSAADRHPVIMVMGPYSGTSVLNTSPVPDGPVVRFRPLAEAGIFDRGYAVVQVDTRGYGGSGGCYDFGGAGEQLDAERAVEWAASQPWSAGKVALWGGSYEGWTQVMALARAPEGLAAAVITAPLLEAYRGLYMNGVHYAGGWYATAPVYGAYDLAPNSPVATSVQELTEPVLGTASDPGCYAENLTATLDRDRSAPYWRERDIVAAAATSTVPVMWVHGFNDANTKPDNILDVWSALAGPKRAWFGQWAHVGGYDQSVGRAGFTAEALEWLDHWLLGQPLPDRPAVTIQDSDGRWRGEEAWPPHDRQVRMAPVLPGQYLDVASESSRGPIHGQDAGSWSFTPPAGADVRLVGAPALSLEVEVPAAPATLVALLYDVGPDGRARLISRGAMLLERSGQTAFELYPQDWHLRAGHRLGLLLAGSDTTWFQGVHTGLPVAVTGGSLAYEVLPEGRISHLDGGPAAAQEFVPERNVSAAMVQSRTAGPAPAPAAS